jgi:2OG-Fe(II) oxygenase superfamily
VPSARSILAPPVQTSLGFQPASGAAGPPRVRRVALDGTSWVEHHPGWLPAAERLFDTLGREARWEHRTRWIAGRNVVEPRLTAEYPVIEDCPIAELVAVGKRLSQQYGVTFDRAWLNLYRDQDDSTSWHADSPASRLPSSLVPVLSLGETRRFLLRRAGGGPSTVLVVEGGDLVVMGGRCQRDWVHAVPKETRARGSRISINFATPSAAR